MKSIIFFAFALFVLASCDKTRIVEEDLNGFDFYEGQELTYEQAKAIGLAEIPGGYIMSGDVKKETGRANDNVFQIYYPGNRTVQYFRTTSGGYGGSWAYIGQKSGSIHTFDLPKTTFYNCRYNNVPMQWYTSQVVSGPIQNTVTFIYYDGTQNCETPAVIGYLNTEWNIHTFGAMPGGLTASCNIARSYSGNCY